jgi:hypothetical protein
MALPMEEWLHLAQRLPVGSTSRTFHGRETRPNLIVGHEHSHYWAYCQACKEGGKQTKDHVLVTGTKAPATSTDLSLPRDLIMVSKCDLFTQESIAHFLAKKCMDMLYMPELWYSAERKRLLLHTKQGWIGRDLTGNSHQKWLTYSRGCDYLCNNMAPNVVLVEDAFSWIKVDHALSSLLTTSHTVSTPPVWSAACLLGTEVRPSLLNRLLSAGTNTVMFLLDGDTAGYRGATRGVRLLKPFLNSVRSTHPPPGLDPKDMQLRELRRLCLNY